MISERTGTAETIVTDNAFVATKPLAVKKKQTQFRLLFVLIAVAVIYIITDYPRGYYRSPLSIRTELAANFGEPRPDHFHMGLDIRTQGRENLPVYAAAEGFVSRITIEENGFGKAVYLQHPNGTTTVYAHLNRFNEKLENAVRQHQYKSECWQQDIAFVKDLFPVSKGSFIGRSGNTGASEGPHLHFEIRDTKTGKNLNPLAAGFILADDKTPVIKNINWYNRSGSIYESSATPFNINTKLLKVNAPFIGFGVEAIDLVKDAHFKMGIYKADLLMDNILQFRFSLDSFSYKDTRYVNACIDYQNLVMNKKNIQYLFRLPGNLLPVYRGSPGNGTLDISDRRLHRIKIIVADIAFNRDSLDFTVQYDGSAQWPKASFAKPLLPGTEQKLETSNATVYFSRHAFYDAAPLMISEEPGNIIGAASPVICLSPQNIPVQDSCNVMIRTTLALNSRLRKHTVMQLTGGKNYAVVKGQWKGNFMEGSFDKLGTIRLLIDTVPPSVTPVELKNECTKNDQSISFLYNDNITGQGLFRAELDGHWILFEQKKNLYTYWFDEHCGKGVHHLRITVTDVAGNTTVKTFVFTWSK